MKIDRLIAIITILLQNEKVTASCLAERFEVSRRTINRDIEDICKAGIPVITQQGAGGGITLPDTYKIDRTLFTVPELKAVFTGLSTLHSVARDQRYQNIMDKFFSHSDNIRAANHMVIDLSSHYKSTLAPKIEGLEDSIERSETVSFTYCGKSGEKQVKLDPYLIVFQWSSWYVLGWEHGGKEFKMYKLNRLWHLKNTGETFSIREIPGEKLKFDNFFTDEIQAVILFDPQAKYRLVEEYGPGCFEESGDGRLLFTFSFTNEDYLITWLLGFGEMAELKEPSFLRPRIKEHLLKTLARY